MEPDAQAAVADPWAKPGREQIPIAGPALCAERAHLAGTVARAFAPDTRTLFGPGAGAVLLFGSTARGTARQDSDVDLCLLRERAPEPARIARALAALPGARHVWHAPGWHPFYVMEYAETLFELYWVSPASAERLLAEVAAGARLGSGSPGARGRHAFYLSLLTQGVVLDGELYAARLVSAARLAVCQYEAAHGPLSRVGGLSEW